MLKKDNAGSWPVFVITEKLFSIPAQGEKPTNPTKRMRHSTLLILTRIMFVLLGSGITPLHAQHTDIRCGNDNAGQLQIIATAEQRISAYRQMVSRPTGLDPGYHSGCPAYTL